ncbi:hypothetical protein, variant 5 [Aphanomyces astaci]|uniref:Uncharacterized protein n=1 Tax=Aphanomyces astaci TaxID=112090 RepID=W4GRG4_APHAT|nr:hypothetical protein, variant 5 [Aphanomyces astaci]ETV81579.1 hypothetical protein, variant 5 [Aphanomyces astaci]|eukprot:XP_009829435.1 hypothetical protein, variant 5 [Aphanomyces astaci]
MRIQRWRSVSECTTWPPSMQCPASLPKRPPTIMSKAVPSPFGSSSSPLGSGTATRKADGRCSASRSESWTKTISCCPLITRLVGTSLRRCCTRTVADKRIVELRKGAFFDSHASTASMEIRIADISKNHQNQKFRVRVDFLWPHVTVAAAVSDPIHVLSKHVKKSLPVEMHLIKSDHSHSSSDDGTPIFRTPPINSPTTSPVVEGPRRPPTPPPTKMEEGDNISIGHGMSMTRWCSAAHRVLTQVEWSPFQDARSAIQFKCQWCFAVQPTLATAQHAAGCLLKSLLTMIDSTDDRSEAPPPLPSSPAPLATKFEMAERLRTATNIYRPVPHYATTTTLKRPNAVPVVDDDDDEHGKDLTLLSIGDLSAFAKSSTFDDALMLKSLSQVSVADDWRCANSPSSSSSPPRQFLMDDDSSLLSRFTDSTICASNTEAAVVAIGVFPLEGCDTGMPAFDGDWTLLGVYHTVPPRLMVSIGHPTCIF